MSHARLVLRPLDQKAGTEMWCESALWEVRWLHIPKYLALRQQTQRSVQMSLTGGTKKPHLSAGSLGRSA